MDKHSVNFYYPPDKINTLPTWRFILSFKLPKPVTEELIDNAIAVVKTLEFKAIVFPTGIENVTIDPKNYMINFNVEVKPDRRAQSGSLEDYEGDVWKFFGHMIECGFGDLYCDSIDWRDNEQTANLSK
jgi:hypothetical protein